jgi:hypothetical protein
VGVAGFEAYPELRVDLGPVDLGLALAVPLVTVAPFLLLRRRGRRGGRDG